MLLFAFPLKTPSLNCGGALIHILRSLILLLLFFKSSSKDIFFIAFRERRQRERERERETPTWERNINWLPPIGAQMGGLYAPRPGIGPTTQVCALTKIEPATLRLLGRRSYQLSRTSPGQDLFCSKGPSGLKMRKCSISHPAEASPEKRMGCSNLVATSLTFC